MRAKALFSVAAKPVKHCVRLTAYCPVSPNDERNSEIFLSRRGAITGTFGTCEICVSSMLVGFTRCNGGLSFEESARRKAGSACLLKSLVKNLAEREGFEPPIPVKVCPLSRRIVSTAHAPLRAGQLFNCEVLRYAQDLALRLRSGQALQAPASLTPAKAPEFRGGSLDKLGTSTAHAPLLKNSCQYPVASRAGQFLVDTRLPERPTTAD